MELWPETWKCSTAATACISYTFLFPWAPNDFKLPLSASLPLGIFWKIIPLTCKPGWMSQGMNTTLPSPPCPQGASLTQRLRRVGVYRTQFPSTESCILHLSPRFSCGIKLWPPTVETGLLMYLLLSALLLLCYFLTFFPVFPELSEKTTTLTQILVSGACFWGNPNKDMLQFCPNSLSLPRIPEQGKYSACKKQRLNGREVLLFK